MDNEWKVAWHKGIVPQITVQGLKALRQGLINDDPNLIQGDTVNYVPHPSGYVNPTTFASVCKACVIAYCVWKSEKSNDYQDIVGRFSTIVSHSKKLGGPEGSAIRFIAWVDRINRSEMRELLLPEVELAIASKESR